MSATISKRRVQGKSAHRTLPVCNTKKEVRYISVPEMRWFVITFGTDSSLTTAPGWDNVTGVGTPDGWNFVNALAP